MLSLTKFNIKPILNSTVCRFSSVVFKSKDKALEMKPVTGESSSEKTLNKIFVSQQTHNLYVERLIENQNILLQDMNNKLTTISLVPLFMTGGYLLGQIIGNKLYK